MGSTPRPLPALLPCSGHARRRSPASVPTRSTTKSRRSLTGLACLPQRTMHGLRTTAATRNGRTGPFTTAPPRLYDALGSTPTLSDTHTLHSVPTTHPQPLLPNNDTNNLHTYADCFVTIKNSKVVL